MIGILRTMQWLTLAIGLMILLALAVLTHAV